MLCFLFETGTVEEGVEALRELLIEPRCGKGG